MTETFHLYSLDNEGIIPGTYWQGPLNLDWGGRQNAAYLANPAAFRHPMEASPLWTYIQKLDRTLECPGGRREANGFYDYTVIIRFAGAKTDLSWQMTYPERPDQPNSRRLRFDSLPLLIEEDARFYNQSYDDGSFAASDQFSDRHDRACNIGYLDGGAGRFVSPKGPNPLADEARDLHAAELRLIAKRTEFSVTSSSALEFGWANAPY